MSTEFPAVPFAFPTDNGIGQRLDPAVCAELISGALLNITSSRYIMVAGLTIALYDILLLFSDEVRLVWTSQSSISVRLLYFFNHYIPPAFLIIANYQMVPFRPPLSTNLSVILSRLDTPRNLRAGHYGDMLLLYVLPPRKPGRPLTSRIDMLTLRVIALYGDYKIIKRILQTLFFLCYGTCIAACVISIIYTSRDMGYFIDLGGVCSFSGNSIWFIIIMTSPIPVEFISGLLTIIKAIQHAHALWNASSAPLLHNVLRDGILFFLAVVALRLCNAFIWLLLPRNSIYLGLYLLWAPLSVMSTRFFLNIKAVASVDPFSTEYSVTMDPRRQSTSSKRGTMVKFAPMSLSQPVSHNITLSIPQSDHTAVSLELEQPMSPDEYEFSIVS